MILISKIVLLVAFLLVSSYGFSTLDIDQEYVEQKWEKLSRELEKVQEFEMVSNDLT
jgi:hypothetical protein